MLSEKKWKSDIETVSLGHRQEKNQGLFTPSKEKSRKKAHSVIPWLVGIGLDGGSLAWHIALLLQQLHLQEALLLGCGLFQFMLEMFNLEEEGSWDTGLVWPWLISF